MQHFIQQEIAILHKNDPQNLNIVDSNKLFFCIQRYLKDKILRDPVMVKKLVLFFASYFDAPYEGDDINDFLETINIKKNIMIRNGKIQFNITHQEKEILMILVLRRKSCPSWKQSTAHCLLRQENAALYSLFPSMKCSA